MKPLIDRAAVVKYYAHGFSLRETGRRFGCNLERVRQILKEDAPQMIRAPYRGMSKSPAERLRGAQPS